MHIFRLLSPMFHRQLHKAMPIKNSWQTGFCDAHSSAAAKLSEIFTKGYLQEHIPCHRLRTNVRKRPVHQGPYNNAGAGSGRNGDFMNDTSALSSLASGLLSGAVKVIDITAPLGPDTPVLYLPHNSAKTRLTLKFTPSANTIKTVRSGRGTG